MRGIEIQKFRAVSSGLKTLEELFGKNGFAVWVDQHHHGRCNMPNPDGAFDKALSIAQQQIYLPLKFRSKCLEGKRSK